MNSSPAAVKSTHSPARSGLIDRGELVAAIDRALERRVTIISAPAGSGKTSLLRAWVDGPGHTRRVAFVSVRPGRHDAQEFWLELLGAIRSAAGAASAIEIPSATPEFDEYAMVDRLLIELASTDRAADSAARDHPPARNEPTVRGGPAGSTADAHPATLGRRNGSSIPISSNGRAGRDSSLVLILDDVHELASPEAFEHLTALLMNLPAHVHVILAARRDPPLRLYRLRLAGELTEIRSARLCFTESETQTLLLASGITLPDKSVRLLHERTEGWAAGLRLAALALAEHPDPPRFVSEFSASDGTVAEYLIAELLDRQPPHVRTLLLRTAVLDRINGELADMLTESTGSERILLELEDATAFVVSLDPERTWFRYHDIFGGLLRSELRRALAQEIPVLHRRAAHWFGERGYAAEAIGHLQAAGQWAQAAGMLADHALGLILDGRAGTVRALLSAFPAGEYAESPDLALVRALGELDGMRLADAAAHLHIARSHVATASPGRRHRVELAVTSTELFLDRLRGHVDGVVDRAAALSSPDHGHTAADIAPSGDLRALVLLNLGVTQAWSLRLVDSRRYLSDGAALALEIGRPYLEVACRAQLGVASTAFSLTEARLRSREALTLAARHGWDEQPVIAPALATLAGTMIWTGELVSGADWLARARRATRGGGEPGLAYLLSLLEGTLAVARGRNKEALATFEAAGRMRMAGEQGLSAQMLGRALSTQARLGSTALARARMAALPEQLLEQDEIRTAAAAISLAEDDPIGALSELRTAFEATGVHTRDGISPLVRDLTRIDALLLEALAYRALHDISAARAAVERALELAEPERLVLPFLLSGAADLLDIVPPHGTSHATLIADIRDAQRGTDPAPAQQDVPVMDLSPSELRLLRHLPTNLTRPEIAAQLSISVNTVNTHIRNIYAKLGVTDRSAAVRRGRELRLLSSARE